MDEIDVAPYDERWPSLFEHEAKRIHDALGAMAERIEHVGSTSVPGLSAKPVVDIMIGVGDLSVSAPQAKLGLKELGYEFWDEDPARSERMFFIRWTDDRRSRLSHVHVAPIGNAFWTELLGFRDRLRADPELAAEYGRLKLELANKYRNDRDAYTAAKTEFVRGVTRPSEAAQ